MKLKSIKGTSIVLTSTVFALSLVLFLAGFVSVPSISGSSIGATTEYYDYGGLNSYRHHYVCSLSSTSGVTYGPKYYGDRIVNYSNSSLPTDYNLTTTKSLTVTASVEFSESGLKANCSASGYDATTTSVTIHPTIPKKSQAIIYKQDATQNLYHTGTKQLENYYIFAPWQSYSNGYYPCDSAIYDSSSVTPRTPSSGTTKSTVNSMILGPYTGV